MYFLSILILSLVFSQVTSAPIRISGDELGLSIQLDTEYSSNLYAKTKLILQSQQYHLIILSDLWSIFGHLLPQTNESDYFSVLGLHTFNSNITLCRRTIISSQNDSDYQHFQSIMNGTNLGIVLKHNHTNQERGNENEQLCLFNPNKDNITVLLLINLYDQFQPIPGGCNFEFEFENSPFILARRFEHFATFSDYALDFQPGSPSPRSKFNYKSYKCNFHITGQRLRYRLYVAYHDYYEEDNQTEAEMNYFRHISSMSHIDWIKENARLIAEMKHESSIGRLYILTANSEPSRRLYFNVLLSDQMIERSEIYEDEFYYSSLYVPVSISADKNVYPNTITDRTFEHSFNLCFVLASLLIFSIIVSLFGYRYFILEVFYFSFLQIFAASICCLTTIKLTPTTHSSRIVNFIESLNVLPSITTWNIMISSIFSLIFSSIWTETCRRSRNIKLALSGHCMVLTSIIVAITFDAFLVFDNSNITLWLSNSTYYLVIVSTLIAVIVLLYSLLFIYLDLFWLSALSTAITTVYLILLPLDMFVFGGGILFRIFYNIWLLSFTTMNTSSGDLIVSFITLNVRDIITVLIYFLLASASIYWQTLTKLGNLRTYGFGCIRPQVKTSTITGSGAGDSPSSTPSTVITALSVINRKRLRRTNLSVQALESSTNIGHEKVMIESHNILRDIFAQESNKQIYKSHNKSLTNSELKFSWREKNMNKKNKNKNKNKNNKKKRSSIISSEMSKINKKKNSNINNRKSKISYSLKRRYSNRYRRSIMKLYRCKYCHKLSTNKNASSESRCIENQYEKQCLSSTHVTLRRQNSLLNYSRKRSSFMIMKRVDTERTRLRNAQIESLNAVQIQFQQQQQQQQQQQHQQQEQEKQNNQKQNNQEKNQQQKYSQLSCDYDDEEKAQISSQQFDDEILSDCESSYEMESMII